MSGDRHARIERLLPMERIRQSRVFIKGLGAMGAQVAVDLVRHGVATGIHGEFIIADSDSVELSNLVRTPYLRDHDGMRKVDALRSLLLAIDPNTRVRALHVQVQRSSLNDIVSIAQGMDLVCNFTGDESLSPDLEDAVYPICPMVKAHFGMRADSAEVGYSIPNQTIALSRTFGKRERTTLHGAEALGVDTMFTTSFVTAICLRLLCPGFESDVLPPVHADAPLYVIGLRRSWIFSDMPAHQERAIYIVGEPDE